MKSNHTKYSKSPNIDFITEDQYRQKTPLLVSTDALNKPVVYGIFYFLSGMAYSMLAEMPPIVGLYLSFFPVLVYFFFASSRHDSMGELNVYVVWYLFFLLFFFWGGVTDRHTKHYTLKRTTVFKSTIHRCNKTIHLQKNKLLKS